MKPIRCEASGEAFTIYQSEDGSYCCPVCGALEFSIPPYDSEGRPSFEMCHCGFEFGYDDSPLASKDAVVGIQANWSRWRRGWVERAVVSPEAFATLEGQLKNIRLRLAFDLLVVPEENET